ncbi:hypothetical protein NHX12_029360 [Muraenolepis orangiensis]|uniref:Uncharacterized protein n=1 Tax=Muraenolepis orangiensis TaxID=630683 RepID=A0A9Q0ECB2_9TELE|nr:hypothetical protein NHX12_029360 [Muraenolepis orangiensis]
MSVSCSSNGLPAVLGFLPPRHKDNIASDFEDGCRVSRVEEALSAGLFQLLGFAAADERRRPPSFLWHGPP